MTGSKTMKMENVLLLLWFALNLGIGAGNVHEFGMSIDEPNNYRYAGDTLAAYPSFFGTLYEPNYDSSYDGHGPAFVVIAGTLVRLVQAVFPDVFEPDLWHYSYFVAFQLTGLCLYWLAKRWFSKWTAWGLLILFSTQPLLLGHAFINPKDIPFMFFFTLSVVVGFQLVDSVPAQEPFVSLKRTTAAITDKFKEANPLRGRAFVMAFALTFIALAALFFFSRGVNDLIEQVVAYFYAAAPDSWAARVFHSVASPTPGVAVEDYVSKAVRLFHRARLGLLITAILFLGAYFGLLINNLTVSNFVGNTWQQRHRLGNFFRKFGTSVRHAIRASSLRMLFLEFLRSLRNPRLILAGVVLGLATGVRAIAPFAGLIALLFLFVKVRSRAWPIAVAYFLVAGVVTYLAWPRLWDAPIPRYLEGLGMISNFPHFPGQVLFHGEFYGPRDLPRSYLPVLLSIQFTEPLILSIYLGLGVLAWRLLRNQLRADLFLYISLGFAFPLSAVILLNSPLYHNFRQTLFIVPAMCLLAAFALELVFGTMTRNWIRVLLIAALALPGVQATVKLHPYQYVYYNSLVGGPAGALNRYELDYWRISLREMALELNERARLDAIIVVTRSAGLLARYTRPDLVVDKPINSTLDLSSGYDYIVQVARWERWDIYPEVSNLVTIERDGLVLATAKDVKGISAR